MTRDLNLVDSSGWLEYFVGGKHAEFYAPAIQATDRLIVPTICQYEVYKTLRREGDRRLASQAIAQMRQGIVMDLDQFLAIRAAVVSSSLKLPMADSIIVATARMFLASIWTQDQDFANLEQVHFPPSVR